jgi:hypothetical protein
MACIARHRARSKRGEFRAKSIEDRLCFDQPRDALQKTTAEEKNPLQKMMVYMRIAHSSA